MTHRLSILQNSYNEVSKLYITYQKRISKWLHIYIHTVFMYTEYLSVLEEECCPRQLYPLSLGPPTRHVQTHKFVLITTGVYWQQDSLSQGVYVRGWDVLVHPGSQAGWHGNNTGGVKLVFQESPTLEGSSSLQAGDPQSRITVIRLW